MRSRINPLILSLVLLLAVVGVQAQDGGEVVVDFYYPTAVDGPIGEVIQRYADQFMAENPGIVINPVYTGSYNQTREAIQTEIAAEDVIVDVAVMLAIDLFSFIEEESIVPAQDFIDEMENGDEWLERFYPAFMANSEDEFDVVWSVPFQRSTPIMYYNADLLAAEGIEVPTNNEELIAAAQALTTEERDGLLVPVAGIFPSWMFQSFAAAYGQPLVEDDPTRVYFDTPEALEALEFVTRLGMSADEGGFAVGPMGGSAWGDTPTAFTSGQAAMIYHTTGSLRSILENADFEVGVSYLPSGPANEDGSGYGSPTGGGNLYIFSNASPEEQAAAWEWVKFLASDEIQADWGANTGYIAATNDAWALDPLASLAEEFPQYFVTRDHLQYATKEFTAYRSIDLQNIINTSLATIISGDRPLADAADVLQRAQQQADGLLEDYR